MKPLTGMIIQLEEKLAEMAQELTAIKMRAYALEEENERLRQEISHIYFAAREEKNKEDHLLALYEEGFHICHLHFGQDRSGQGCLFCLGLLKRMGDRESLERATGL